MPADPRRVKELFVAALDLTDEPARLAFLDRECAGDAELRRRLDDLLRPTIRRNRPLTNRWPTSPPLPKRPPPIFKSGPAWSSPASTS